ncbi:MAG: N-acetylglucosamine kinase [Pyrinomonadaceae bacterium]
MQDGLQKNEDFSLPDLTLGVDGGGTKTTAIIADQNDRLLGEGIAGPSNPLRVGIMTAASNIEEAVEKACLQAGVNRHMILAAEIGLAGVRLLAIRRQMHEALQVLGINPIEVVTDADIALAGATNGKPGLVIIAGTGSNCCGLNAIGEKAWAGGWGPIAGDEGSGIEMAKRALQMVARASDGRGRETLLTKAACEYFAAVSVDDLARAIYEPNITNDRIAGFGKFVVKAAEEGDPVALKIVSKAGRQLAMMAIAVIHKLGIERERFPIAYVGGVFAAGELILSPIRKEIEAVAAEAFLAPPEVLPAVAATRVARALLQQTVLIK